jgi:hypothetical protein
LHWTKIRDDAHVVARWALARLALGPIRNAKEFVAAFTRKLDWHWMRGTSGLGKVEFFEPCENNPNALVFQCNLQPESVCKSKKLNGKYYFFPSGSSKPN